jgi:16S rRNA (adenine1518-N6/adenine1519-N6)-dimethyltransferase
MEFQAKKSLGQNFFKSEKALNTMVESAEIGPNDTVIEIGPGYGALTEKILEVARQVIAIEKDDNLFSWLNERFIKEIAGKKLVLIHKDILEVKPEDLVLIDQPYKIAANIPYNITGAIIRQFLTTNHQPTQMSLLVQKEVADRIVARNKKESLLSISVKVYAEPKIIVKVPKESFQPVPKVDSAIISFQRISRDFFTGISEEKFFQILHAGFAHKRKTLGHNLKEIFGKETEMKLSASGLTIRSRAEDLSREEWKKLCQA